MLFITFIKVNSNEGDNKTPNEFLVINEHEFISTLSAGKWWLWFHMIDRLFVLFGLTCKCCSLPIQPSAYTFLYGCDQCYQIDLLHEQHSSRFNFIASAKIVYNIYFNLKITFFSNLSCFLRNVHIYAQFVSILKCDHFERVVILLHEIVRIVKRNQYRHFNWMQINIELYFMMYLYALNIWMIKHVENKYKSQG